MLLTNCLNIEQFKSFLKWWTQAFIHSWLFRFSDINQQMPLFIITNALPSGILSHIRLLEKIATLKQLSVHWEVLICKRVSLVRGNKGLLIIPMPLFLPDKTEQTNIPRLIPFIWPDWFRIYRIQDIQDLPDYLYKVTYVVFLNSIFRLSLYVTEICLQLEHVLVIMYLKL